VPAAVVVRAVELPTGEGRLDPPEDQFVADVQPESDLRPASVAAEVAFPDEKAREQPNFEFGRDGGGSLEVFHRRVTPGTSTL